MIKQEKKKVEAVILTFFTLCRQGPVRGHQFDGVIPEMGGDRVVGPAELLAYVGLSHAACFPSAIQMFEPLPSESRLGLITEN